MPSPRVCPSDTRMQDSRLEALTGEGEADQAAGAPGHWEPPGAGGDIGKHSGRGV